MPFMLHDFALDTKHGLATATLYETQGKQNRVVHVIVPLAKAPRRAVATRTKQARALMKAALQDAAETL
ncbi:MAG TPA: hypothetical protein VGW34_07570 [Allosphingosinicella sp.]|nr:hypothetical protein [Allosphingosinicella sp.]